VVSGGVPAPGASGLNRQLGGGDRVVAEGIGDDGGGHLQDVLADRGGSAGDGGDADAVDVRCECLGVHRLPGPAPGKQPARVAIRRCVHVVAVLDPVQQEIGDRSWDRGWWFAEA